jgi:MFS family permease
MAHNFVVKKIPLWPVLRVSFILFIIIGIVIGVFYAIMLSVWGAFMSSFAEAGFGEQFGLLRGLGFVLIPIIAVLYAVFGTIIVAIWTLVYNLLAAVVGGVELVLEESVSHTAATRVPPGSGDTAHVPPDKTITGF